MLFVCYESVIDSTYCLLLIVLMMSGFTSVLQMNDQLDCALDLMRRLPPQQITKNLCDLIDLVLAENVFLMLMRLS